MKRTPLKRKPTWKKLKRSSKPLKKKSTQSLATLKRLADRKLQDWYRANYEGTCCEVCDRPFQLMHHFVEKSQSAGLRYEDKNLIFLCHECHASHHLAGNPHIVSTILRKRGYEWYDQLHKLRLARKNTNINKSYLNEQLSKYTLT